MGDFEEHRRTAILAGLIVAIDGGYVLYLLGYPLRIVGLGSGLLCVGTVIIGLAPDIDVWSSVPRRYFGYGLLAGLPAGAAYQVYTNPDLAIAVGHQLVALVGVDGVPPIIAGSTVFLVGAVGIAKSVGYGLDEYVTHRGRFHTVSFWAAIGAIGGAVGFRYFDVPFVIAAVGAIAVVIGAVVHIKIVDGM